MLRDRLFVSLINAGIWLYCILAAANYHETLTEFAELMIGTRWRPPVQGAVATHTAVLRTRGG